MKLKVLAIMGVLLWGLSAPAPTVAEATGAYEEVTAEDTALMELYFDKEQLVEAATRHPKPLSQIAENVTVITDEEIRTMNAHSVAEVLNRVTGVFVDFAGRDFVSESNLRVQGSNDFHVLVLVDEIPWNFLAGGNPATDTIPVGIIDRIEIIKGPASSTWGSSLGGVINIITKDAGESRRLRGMVSGSYGEGESADLRAEAAGRTGAAGYYLFAGKQSSDGLRFSRDFENNAFFGKTNLALNDRSKLVLSAGYTEPEFDLGFGDQPEIGLIGEDRRQTFFTSALFTTTVSDGLTFTSLLYRYDQKLDQLLDESGLFGPRGDLYRDVAFDEETVGGSSRLAWLEGQHTAVLGLDYRHGELEQATSSGAFLQASGAGPVTTIQPATDQWAAYLNDTIVLDEWTVTPGIRYDYDSNTGSFVSPSLGLTYRLRPDTLLRGTVARGFTSPPLSFLAGGGLFVDPNSDLEPEPVWSFQTGLETTVLPYAWVKLSLFQHDVREAIELVDNPGNDIFVNQGKNRRRGLELETEVKPYRHLSLRAGGAYVHSESFTGQTFDFPQANLGLRYDDGFFMADLFGHYVWWPALPGVDGSFDDFIWDLNLSKRIPVGNLNAAEFFFTIHNLFSGSQFASPFFEDPDRWAETGLRWYF